MSNAPRFVLDSTLPPLDADGIPTPSGPPAIVEQMIRGEAESAPSFQTVRPGASAPWGAAAPVANSSVASDVASDVAPTDQEKAREKARVAADAHLANVALPTAEASRRGSPFESPFPRPPSIPRLEGSPTLDDSVHAPPIAPGDEAYEDLKQPGVIEGSQYAAAFSLQQLREAQGTHKYVYEGLRIRSASPCRTCKNGSEYFGIAEAQSQTYTPIARRMVCNYYKADVTSNVILHCAAHEKDEKKISNFRLIKDIEHDLRSRFGLTAAPGTKWDAQADAEEREFTARALGVVVADAPADMREGAPDFWPNDEPQRV